MSELKQILEGAILAADQPLSIDQMISLFDKDQPARAEVKAVLTEIEMDCEGRGFQLKEVASGYRFQVRQEYAEWVGRLWEERPPRYSRALLETLALIAYKQPITRGDIEEIRGVAVSTNIMRSLLEREWVRVVGHRDVPGRPAIYATTKTFLDYFDLDSLEALPTLSEIKDLAQGTEDLDLEGDIVEVRTLELGIENLDEATGIEDADLEKVTEEVNAIQDNIRNLFDQDDEDDEVGAEDSLQDVQAQASTMPDTILNAAVADDSPVDGAVGETESSVDDVIDDGEASDNQTDLDIGP
ncbi:MAG: SMC-Scp complex subunit ScpB [Gammaproteobacteria bacterium]|jgi:segregation and condensation protein B|nr:SMC-Scp complex subunit ScpB [Gammaproteobacteria bacterium]|tara:strand:+ start:337 stop:1233 length:897 start_codon:yes stop_codon:yes gene_type:complete